MKLKLKQYTEPLIIEVERPDGTTDTVELTLNLSDTNVLRSEKAARKIAEAANGMTGEDYERQTRELGRLVADAIDVVAGEGAAEKIVAVESSPHMRGALFWTPALHVLADKAADIGRFTLVLRFDPFS